MAARAAGATYGGNRDKARGRGRIRWSCRPARQRLHRRHVLMGSVGVPLVRRAGGRWFHVA